VRIYFVCVIKYGPIMIRTGQQSLGVDQIAFAVSQYLNA